MHTIGCAGGRSAIVEQASLFFGAASAARDLDVDRDLRIEMRPAHLRTPSLPEVALRAELQQWASSRAMRLSASGGHVGRLSSFFESALAARDVGIDRGLRIKTHPTQLRSLSLTEVALFGGNRSRASSRAMPLSVLFARKWAF